MDLPHRIQRFEVLGRLGHGGMGTVVRARDPQLEREVAIKLLAAPEIRADELSAETTIDLRGDAPTSADALLHEARMMARLSHPNVLPVYEAGLTDGAVFLVMECVDGCDLATWLTVERTQSEIRHVLAQAARGLAAAHAHGIAHGDFKPSNVLLGLDGRVRVADFGLARITARDVASMVRTAEQGTPRYMAPERWNGEPPSPSADVFAFCLTATESLGDDPLLVAGLADDPAKRPKLSTLVAALEVIPVPDPVAAGTSRRRLAIGAVAGLLAVGGVSGLVLHGWGGRRTDCAVPVLADRFDDSRAAAVRAALPHRAGDLAIVDRAITQLTEQQRAIDTGLQTVCVAAADGRLTSAQAEVRASCIERRHIELSIWVDWLIQHPDIDDAGDVQMFTTVEDCDESIASPLPADRSPVRAMYRRFREESMGRGTKQIDHSSYLEIEQAAMKLGERELAARAVRAHGRALGFVDRLEEADEAFARSYHLAHEIRATNLAALALLDRSDLAVARSNAAVAKQLAALALELASAPTTPIAVRVAVVSRLAAAERARGDSAAAIDHVRRGLGWIAASGRHFGTVELSMWFTLTTAMVDLPAQVPAAVPIARETVALAARLLGERDPNVAVARNLLAMTLRAIGDVDGAIVERRAALALLISTMPAESGPVARQRLDLANDLYERGEFAAARAEVEGLLEASAHNERLAGVRPQILYTLAHATFAAGQLEAGLELGVRAHEASLAVNGASHPWTMTTALFVAEAEIDTGKLADAARHIAALEVGYRSLPSGGVHELGRLHGTASAGLALARGDDHAAETIARKGLGELAELREADQDRVRPMRNLGVSLLGQKRWQEARTTLETALSLAHATRSRMDTVASIEIELARIDVATGRTAVARERALRVRDTLVRFPSPRILGLVTSILGRE